MHHMVFLNPRRSATRRNRRIPKRGVGGRFLPRATAFKARRKVTRKSNKITIMATRSRVRRARRVRRNPPKMTPAMRRKIGARIRALHRAGKYRSSRKSSGGSRKRRSSARRASSVVRYSAPRRSASRRRRSGSGSRMSIGGGMLGIKSVLNRENLMMAGGALGATFITNYANALIAPKLPNNLGANPFVQAAIKLAVGGLTAKLVQRYSPAAARGVLVGTALVIANDFIRKYGLPGITAPTTAAYLGGGKARGPMGQYLGRPAIGPVSPTAGTFNQNGLSGVYGGGSAFKGDAWSR